MFEGTRFTAERFWSKARISGPEDCWGWAGKIDRHGYGEIAVMVDHRKRSFRAHRVAYELLVGPIPDGLVIDHLCRVRACVNPAHMEPVTVGENTRRGDAGKHFRGSGFVSVQARREMAKTHCIHGHEFTPENTYLRRGKWRCCRTCADARRRRFNGVRGQ